MVTRTRRILKIAAAVATVMFAMACSSARAGLISSIGSENLSKLLLGEDYGLLPASPSMGGPAGDESNDHCPLPRWPELSSVLVLVGMQAARSAGMTSTSSVVSGSSPGHAPAALLGASVDLADPPLRDRICDQPNLILPSGPIFELLRPA